MAKKEKISLEKGKRIADIVYDLEESFLAVFRKYSDEEFDPEECLNSLAIASAHVIQVIEDTQPTYGKDVLGPFINVLKESHKLYKQNPTVDINPRHTTA